MELNSLQWLIWHKTEPNESIVFSTYVIPYNWHGVYIVFIANIAYSITHKSMTEFLKKYEMLIFI